MYKMEKYRNPSQSSKVELSFDVHTVEVSSLGFVAASCMRKFLHSLSVPAMQAPEVRCLGETALRCSFLFFAAATSPGPVISSTPTFTEPSHLCSTYHQSKFFLYPQLIVSPTCSLKSHDSIVCGHYCKHFSYVMLYM